MFVTFCKCSSELGCLEMTRYMYFMGDAMKVALVVVEDIYLALVVVRI